MIYKKDYVTQGENILCNFNTDNSQLSTYHEETDIRMIIHDKHAAENDSKK